MTITIQTSSGIILAEVDSDTIFSGRIKVTYHACPECGQNLFLGRDAGHWYFAGNSDCSSCRGTWALPTEEELADMLKKAERS